MRVRRFLPFLTVLLLLACSTIDCPVENIVEVRYAVKAFDGDVEVADTLKDTLNVWATRQNRNDTLIYNGVPGDRLAESVEDRHRVDYEGEHASL